MLIFIISLIISVWGRYQQRCVFCTSLAWLFCCCFDIFCDFLKLFSFVSIVVIMKNAFLDFDPCSSHIEREERFLCNLCGKRTKTKVLLEVILTFQLHLLWKSAHVITLEPHIVDHINRPRLLLRIY